VIRIELNDRARVRVAQVEPAGLRRAFRGVAVRFECAQRRCFTDTPPMFARSFNGFTA
jgi:hypothetical protein